MAPNTAGLLTLFLVVLHGYTTTADTTNSPLFEHGAQFGDKDYQEAVPLSLNFSINFLGFSYRQLFISADGTVGFNKFVNYDSSINYITGVKNPSFDVPFIAPLLYNGYRAVKISPEDYQGKITYLVVNYKEPVQNPDQQKIKDYLGHYLHEAVVSVQDHVDVKFLVIITWENVAEKTDTSECTFSQPCNSTTFQIVLTGDDTQTFAIFNYGLYDISVQPRYMAGFNGGYGRGWYSVLPCHGGCEKYLHESAIRNLSNFQGSDLKGRYIFSVGQETVIRGGCLPQELTARVLEVHPRSVGMFGGEKIEVSGLCGIPNATIYCKFGSAADPSSQVVAGAMVSSMKGYCSVPLLATTGHLDVYWSNDNSIWSADKQINIVLPSRLGDPVAVEQAVEKEWHERDSASITVKWDPNKFSKTENFNVNVTLLGYREQETRVEYKELVSFGLIPNRQGRHTINVEQHRCKIHCEDFEFGLLEVSVPQQHHYLATERVAQRFGPIPLGWYVNQELKNTKGSDWSNQKCMEWHEADSQNKDWLKDLLPCPCSLDQALADFGRWQTDPGCSVFAGSLCHYHQGAKHCVRSVVPTSKDGAGNQCCYGPDGTLMYSQLSDQGSTPDRSHVWGAHPYNRPNSVPELSHWKHDVISFYYCCLWNDYELCDQYMELRPTVSCHNYDVPGLALVHGLTHITTFDGLTYHFTGYGDFLLVNYQAISLEIHGKFEPRSKSWDFGGYTNTSSWRPRALTGLGLSSGTRRIEVSLAPGTSPHRRELDISVSGNLIHFPDKASFWRDFGDFSVLNHATDVAHNYYNNFTFLMTRFSVGVNVVAVNNLLHVTVAIPPVYKPKSSSQRANVVGLLGSYDTRPENDYLPPQGDHLSLSTDKKLVFQRFIFPWKVDNTSQPIFRFPTPALDFDQQRLYFELTQLPANIKGGLSESQVSTLCGRDNENCIWDARITGEQNVATATRDTDTWFRNIKRSARRVDNCGLPEVGQGATLNLNNFSVGNEIKVKCGPEKSLVGPDTFTCVSESLNDAQRQGREEYGTRWTDPSTTATTIVHWVPQPDSVCSAETESASNLGLIIGAAVGGVLGVILIIVIIIIIVRRKKAGNASTTEKAEKRAGKADKRGTESDPRAAEAMLAGVEERSPVYKPSKEAVRLSEVEGSNV